MTKLEHRVLFVLVRAMYTVVMGSGSARQKEGIEAELRGVEQALHAGGWSKGLHTKVPRGTTQRVRRWLG